MDWVMKYWIQWLFGIIGAALIFCIRQLWKMAKYERTEQKAIRESLKAILHDRIYEAFRYYMKTGCIDQPGLENLDTLWEAYVHWGGNGTGKTYYQKVKDLPIVDYVPPEGCRNCRNYEDDGR